MLIAIEAIHKKKKIKEELLWKIDIGKEYDQVGSDFVDYMLHKMGSELDGICLQEIQQAILKPIN